MSIILPLLFAASLTSSNINAIWYGTTKLFTLPAGMPTATDSKNTTGSDDFVREDHFRPTKADMATYYATMNKMAWLTMASGSWYTPKTVEMNTFEDYDTFLDLTDEKRWLVAYNPDLGGVGYDIVCSKIGSKIHAYNWTDFPVNNENMSKAMIPSIWYICNQCNPVEELYMLEGCELTYGDTNITSSSYSDYTIESHTLDDFISAMYLRYNPDEIAVPKGRITLKGVDNLAKVAGSFDKEYSVYYGVGGESYKISTSNCIKKASVAYDSKDGDSSVIRITSVGSETTLPTVEIVGSSVDIGSITNKTGVRVASWTVGDTTDPRIRISTPDGSVTVSGSASLGTFVCPSNVCAQTLSDLYGQLYATSYETVDTVYVIVTVGATATGGFGIGYEMCMTNATQTTVSDTVDGVFRKRSDIAEGRTIESSISSSGNVTYLIDDLTVINGAGCYVEDIEGGVYEAYRDYASDKKLYAVSSMAWETAEDDTDLTPISEYIDKTNEEYSHDDFGVQYKTSEYEGSFTSGMLEDTRGLVNAINDKVEELGGENYLSPTDWTGVSVDDLVDKAESIPSGVSCGVNFGFDGTNPTNEYTMILKAVPYYIGETFDHWDFETISNDYPWTGAEVYAQFGYSKSCNDLVDDVNAIAVDTKRTMVMEHDIDFPILKYSGGGASGTNITAYSTNVLCITTEDVIDGRFSESYTATNAKGCDGNDPVYSVGSNSFYRAFYNCPQCEVGLFPECTKVGTGAFMECFSQCPNMRDINFSKLQTASLSSFNKLAYRSYTATNVNGVANFAKLKEADDNSFEYAFYGCSKLDSAYFNEVTNAGNMAFYRAFVGCPNISFIADTNTLATTPPFSKLEKCGTNAFERAFWGDGISRISMDELLSCGAHAFNEAFGGDTEPQKMIDNISFPSLVDAGGNAFEGAFAYKCDTNITLSARQYTSVTNISFPKLKNVPSHFMYDAFGHYTSNSVVGFPNIPLRTLDFRSTTNVVQDALCFGICTNLQSIRFDSCVPSANYESDWTKSMSKVKEINFARVGTPKTGNGFFYWENDEYTWDIPWDCAILITNNSFSAWYDDYTLYWGNFPWNFYELSPSEYDIDIDNFKYIIVRPVDYEPEIVSGAYDLCITCRVSKASSVNRFYANRNSGKHYENSKTNLGDGYWRVNFTGLTTGEEYKFGYDDWNDSNTHMTPMAFDYGE